MNDERAMPFELKKAIAANFEATVKFASLSDSQLSDLISGASQIRSQAEMDDYVIRSLLA
ncbi:hypothetical protein SDC9_74328 [bioreactor metagenome]|uniref:Uncharacterized protein n=1 Tax=bioreactor metagenome TaxID=1076179 RepID=A0A644YNZ3_9ZZZZ